LSYIQTRPQVIGISRHACLHVHELLHHPSSERFAQLISSTVCRLHENCHHHHFTWRYGGLRAAESLWRACCPGSHPEARYICQSLMPPTAPFFRPPPYHAAITMVHGEGRYAIRHMRAACREDVHMDNIMLWAWVMEYEQNITSPPPPTLPSTMP